MASIRTFARGTLPLVAGAALVVWIWSFNADRIGPFYDYSIIINNLQAHSCGMVPYKDYPSALQSGVVWVARASESCFGHSYHSLAIGNLVLSLATFLAAFAILNVPIGPVLAALVGLGFCAATTLQHGILWYNSLAIVLIGIQSLLIASIPIERFSPWKHLWPVLAVALLSGSTKINYHLLGVAFGSLLLSRIFVVKYGWWKGLIWLAVVALVLLAAVMSIVTVQIREAVAKVPKRQKKTDVTPVENAQDNERCDERGQLKDSPKCFARIFAL